MAIFISKYFGVPAHLNTAKRQFSKLKRGEGLTKSVNGKYLVLKYQKTGAYKGLPVNYIYEHKPRGGFLKVAKLKGVK